VSDLGSRRASGALSADNKVLAGGWVVEFNPAVLGVPGICECYHIAIRGPSGSYFEIWLDDTFYSIAARGDKNDWDPNQPMTIRPGQTIYFYWSVAAGAAPRVTIFLRQPTT